MESRTDYTEDPFEAPEGELESRIANIWQDILNVGPIGRADNFIELGGTSLRAAQCCHRLATELATNISVQSLIGSEDLVAFAAAVIDG